MRYAALTGVVLVCLLAGCTTPDPALTPQEMVERSAPPMGGLGPGDVLEIKFFYVPELNEIQTVRPDGRIVLQLVGEVDTTGKSPQQLTDELRERYIPLLRKPEVAVITRKLADRRVFVGGEVNAPGPVDMEGRMYALEAIMSAGGFNSETAEVKNVVIVRHLGGQRYGAVLDFSKALKGGQAPPFELLPRDIIYVPKTRITQVNTWIDQHINKIIPKVGVRVSFPAGDGTLSLDWANNN